jgi:hypothetical protein
LVAVVVVTEAAVQVAMAVQVVVVDTQVVVHQLEELELLVLHVKDTMVVLFHQVHTLLVLVVVQVLQEQQVLQELEQAIIQLGVL